MRTLKQILFENTTITKSNTTGTRTMRKVIIIRKSTTRKRTTTIKSRQNHSQ